MAIVLNIVTQAAVAATEHGQGSEDDITVVAGKSLKIETSPTGVTIFDAETPAGKVRNYSINVSYAETDA